MPRGQVDPHRKHRVIPVALHEALIADRATGLSVARIAEYYGLTPSTVHSFFSNHGVKPPAKIQRKMRKDTAIPPQEWDHIVARYRAGEKARQIAAEYGVSPSALSRIFRAKGVPLVMGNPPKVGPEHDAEILADRKAGMSLQAIAEKYGFSVRSVETRLRDQGFLAGDWRPPRDMRYRDLYAQGWSLTRIAKEYGVSGHHVIARWLEADGLRSRLHTGLSHTKATRRLTGGERQEIVRLYRNGYGIDAISEKVGCSRGTARTWVRRAGLRLRKPGEPSPYSREKIRQTHAGVKRSQATREKMAQTQARLMAAGGAARRVSRLEDAVAAWLDAHRIAYERQVSLKLLDGRRKRWRVADLRLSNGGILEVYGTFWHCDPRVYDEPVSVIQTRHQSEDIERARLYSANGLRWAIVWENDFRTTPDVAMTTVLQGLLGNEVMAWPISTPP